MYRKLSSSYDIGLKCLEFYTILPTESGFLDIQKRPPDSDETVRGIGARSGALRGLGDPRENGDVQRDRRTETQSVLE